MREDDRGVAGRWRSQVIQRGRNLFDFLKGRDTVHSGRESAIQGSGKITKLTNHVATREMK